MTRTAIRFFTDGAGSMQALRSKMRQLLNQLRQPLRPSRPANRLPIQTRGNRGFRANFVFQKTRLRRKTGSPVGNFTPAQKLLGFSLNLKTDEKSLKIRYKGNVKGVIQSGTDGQYVGSSDAKNRLIGFAVELEGDAATKFSVEYSAKLAGSAQAAKAKNGAFIGTAKKTGKAIEEISVKLVKK